MPVTHDAELSGYTIKDALWYIDGIGWSKDNKSCLLVKMAAYTSEENRVNGVPPLVERTVTVSIDFAEPSSTSCQLFNMMRSEIYTTCEEDFKRLLEQGVVVAGQVRPPVP